MHELHGPEQPSPPDIADERVRAQLRREELPEPRAHAPHVVEETVAPDDLLHGQRGGAGDGVGLEGVTAGERAVAAAGASYGVEDALVDQDAGERDEAAAEGFADGL